MSIKKLSLAFVVTALMIVLLGTAAPVNRGDIVQFTGDVHIRTDEVVNGDVVVFSGDVVVDGRVNGDVVAFSGKVIVNGEIDGDVVTLAGRVNQGEGSRITGTLVTLEPGTHIRNIGRFGIPSFRIWSPFKVLNFLGFMVLSIITVALIPNPVTNMRDYLPTNFARVSLIGLLSLVAFPAVVIALLLTIVGIVIIPFAVILYAAAGFLGYVAIAVFLGYKVAGHFNLSESIIIHAVIGVALLWLVNQVPFISFLIFLAVVIISLGLVIDTKFGTLKPWLKKKTQ